MSRVTVEPRAAAMIKRLKKLQDTIEDPAPILEEVSHVLRAGVISRFHSKTSPTGRPWKLTKRSRRKGRKSILVDKGVLRDSIEVSLREDKLRVGTDLWYARVHQEGGKIDAKYRLKEQSLIGTISLRALATAGGRARKIASIKKRLLQGSSGRKARNVRLPARKFLGVSKRERKRTTKILIDKLNEAMT